MKKTRSFYLLMDDDDRLALDRLAKWSEETRSRIIRDLIRKEHDRQLEERRAARRRQEST